MNSSEPDTLTSESSLACPDAGRACAEPRRATSHSSLATASLPVRCHHKTSSGKPCRYLARTSSRYCKRHDKSPRPEVDALSAELASVANNFTSPEDVKNVLVRIFLALAADLITERRAGVLCYLTHTILQAQRAHAYCQKQAPPSDTREADQAPGADHLPLTWNLPRSPEDLARMAEHNPRAALAIIRAQCAAHLNKEEHA